MQNFIYVIKFLSSIKVADPDKKPTKASQEIFFKYQIKSIFNIQYFVENFHSIPP